MDERRTFFLTALGLGYSALLATVLTVWWIYQPMIGGTDLKHIVPGQIETVQPTGVATTTSPPPPACYSPLCATAKPAPAP